MIKDSILSFQVTQKDSERVQRAIVGDIPFAIVFVKRVPYIFFHGTASVKGMRAKASQIGRLKPALLKKATFISCYGAYAPKWIQKKHLKPIQSELTLEWVEMGDGSVAYFVYE